MKKYIILLLFVLSIVQLKAQNPTNSSKEKIEAMRNAYITSQMNLTPDESQKFWPIYNEYRAELDQLDRPKKEIGKTIEQMTEAEVKQLIYKELEVENQRNLISKKYVDKFLLVISAKKLIKLRQAEREFKKMMIEQLRKK